MEDNLVFNSPSQGQENQTASSLQQVSSSPPVSSPLSPPPPFEDSPFPFSLILKIIGGVVLLGIVIFLTVTFILPRFSQKNSEKVTLAYWGLWEDEKVMEGIIKDFERKNPNISVTYTKQDPKQYRDRLITRMQNGSGPDIFRYHNTWLPMLERNLLPLPKDIISSKEFTDKYYPVVQSDLIKNGAIYGIPLEIDTLSLFINTDILTAGGYEAPETWDDFIHVAKQTTVVDENGKIKTAGAALGTFDNINHAPDIISLLFIQNGANIKNFSANSKKAVDALIFYTSFTKPENHQDKVWDDTLDPSLVAFAKGNLTLYFGYSWDVFTLKAMNPSLNFTITEVPRLVDRKYTVASYWVEGVSGKSKNSKEALLFLKYLSQKDTVEKLFTETSKTRLFGEPYPHKELSEKVKDNPLLYPFVKQAPFATSSFFVSDTYDNGMNSQMNVYLGNAIRSIINNNTSPESAVETLSQGVSSVLKQYGQ